MCVLHLLPAESTLSVLSAEECVSMWHMLKVFDVLLTCVADDEVSLLYVLCYRVFESKSLQSDVWTVVSSWKERSSSNLKNQTLIATSL